MRKICKQIACKDYYGTRSGPDELVFRYADTPEEASSLYEAGEVSAVWTLTEEQLALEAQDAEWQALMLEIQEERQTLQENGLIPTEQENSEK